MPPDVPGNFSRRRGNISSLFSDSRRAAFGARPYTRGNTNRRCNDRREIKFTVARLKWRRRKSALNRSRKCSRGFRGVEEDRRKRRSIGTIRSTSSVRHKRSWRESHKRDYSGREEEPEVINACRRPADTTATRFQGRTIGGHKRTALASERCLRQPRADVIIFQRRVRAGQCSGMAAGLSSFQLSSRSPFVIHVRRVRTIARRATQRAPRIYLTSKHSPRDQRIILSEGVLREGVTLRNACTLRGSPIARLFFASFLFCSFSSTLLCKCIARTGYSCYPPPVRGYAESGA